MAQAMMLARFAHAMLMVPKPRYARPRQVTVKVAVPTTLTIACFPAANSRVSNEWVIEPNGMKRNPIASTFITGTIAGSLNHRLIHGLARYSAAAMIHDVVNITPVAARIFSGVSSGSRCR